MSRPALARYWSETEHDGRGYLRPSTGEQVPGVTSITGMVNKDLAQWGSDMAVKWIAEHWYEWNPGQRSEESAFNGARYRWKEYRDERGQIGSNVHDHIEQTILGKQPVLDFLTPEEQAMFRQWEDFQFFTGAEFTSTEEQVWGSGYGGTLDARATMYSQKLGRKATFILDWKSSRKAYPEYHMQISALLKAGFTFHQVDPPAAGDKIQAAHNGTTWYQHSLGPAWLATHSENNRKVETWWVEVETGSAQTGAVVHLTPDSWHVYELEDEELHFKRFNAYKDAWWAERELKTVLAARGQKLDRPLDWVDPKWKGRQ